MIAYLNGKVKSKGKNFVVVELDNIGYQVFISPILITELKPGQEVEFFTYQYVREDALELFGFRTQEELELFGQLLSVTGIGPKTALGVLSITKPKEIKSAVAKGDSSLLIKVSGIGRKTAERLILELQDKFEVTTVAGQTIKSEDGEVIDALVGLGYSLRLAREALQKVPEKIEGTGARVKEALKILGSN